MQSSLDHLYQFSSIVMGSCVGLKCCGDQQQPLPVKPSQAKDNFSSVQTKSNKPDPAKVPMLSKSTSFSSIQVGQGFHKSVNFKIQRAYDEKCFVVKGVEDKANNVKIDEKASNLNIKVSVVKSGSIDSSSIIIQINDNKVQSLQEEHPKQNNEQNEPKTITESKLSIVRADYVEKSPESDHVSVHSINFYGSAISKKSKKVTIHDDFRSQKQKGKSQMKEAPFKLEENQDITKTTPVQQLSSHMNIQPRFKSEINKDIEKSALVVVQEDHEDNENQEKQEGLAQK